MTDLKEKAAGSALSLIIDNQVVGLGAGSTIAHLVKLLVPKIQAGLNIQFVTSSAATLQLLSQQGFKVLPASELSKIDVYFDGCDQVDSQLNALKSGGGIHTMEKLLASMANEFVIIGDESKLVRQFDQRFPLVLEVLPQAVSYLLRRIQELLPLSRFSYRNAGEEAVYLTTENGNYLLDVWLIDWPDLSTLNGLLNSITGVVETSLFYKLAHKAIIAGTNHVQTLERVN